MIYDLRTYMGWDPREREAYAVATDSLFRHASRPVHHRSIILEDLVNILRRPIERRDGKLWCPISQAPMATEFACSRFVVPFLQRDGWALFTDCDVLFLGDVAELFDLADERYALMCVKHGEGGKGVRGQESGVRSQESGVNGAMTPDPCSLTPPTKMDGQIQTFYNRKNWSSVVLWNCGHPAHRALTLEALNTWPGRDLHAFKWLTDDLIGALPPEWNRLVGVGNEEWGVENAKILHFTLGGPWFENWKGGPHDDVWRKAKSRSQEAGIRSHGLTPDP